MLTSPLTGIVLFLLGGFVGAVYPICFKKISGWSHEAFWLVFVFFGLFLVPFLYGVVTVPSFFGVLHETPPHVLLRCIGFGMLWGLGSICFGLTLRYIGVGLAVPVVSGICIVVGTLLPPLFKGQGADLFGDSSSRILLGSMSLMVVGILFVAAAAARKDRELSEESKRKAIPDYDFKKGVFVAIVAGFASACMNFGLQAGDRIGEIALAAGCREIWKGIPVMFLTMFGGFLVSLAWCLWQLGKNKSYRDYVSHEKPFWRNVLWAGALPGLLWAIQPVSLKMGEPMMGRDAYIGFAVVMASSFLFGTLIGLVSGEWKGTGQATRRLLWIGVLLLLLASILCGVAGAVRAT